MRCLILSFALAATACAQEKPVVSEVLAAGTYTGSGRDAFCIAGQAGGQRAGFVTYGADDANCSASGRIGKAGAAWALLPAGDADCKIPFSVDKGQVLLGRGTAGCAYYCGLGATFAGTSFRGDGRARRVSDFGGDPLC